MKSNQIIVLLLFCMITVVKGANINAEKNVSQIVTINDDGSFEVEFIEETIVLNRNGHQYAKAFFRYGDLYDVKNLKAEIIANGKTQKVKSKEFLDVSADYGGNITGERIIYYQPTYPVYPYVVRYSYKIECSSLFFLEFFGAWSPISSEEVKVKKYYYEFNYNHLFNIHKQFKGDTSLYTVSEKQDGITIEMENYVSESEKHYYVPGLDQDPGFVPQPNKFFFEGSFVDMSSWRDYGNWFYKLNEGRDKLPENKVQEVKSLIQDTDSELEKIEKLYKYLQNNTRYVSIQLGIGGWQSMTAESVAANGYGDCKGLSTYMKGMLEVAGIKSNYVLVGATYGKMHQPYNIDVPENNFNHVFLVVPMEEDTIWLECTSSNTDMNYSGFHIGNRTALLVDKNGSKLIKTPSFTYEENAEDLKIVYDLEKDIPTFEISKTVKGNKAYMEGLDNDYNLKINEIKKRMKRNLPFQVSSLNDFKVEKIKELNPTFQLTLKGESKGLMSSAGNNRVIRPLMICKLDERIKLELNYNRKFHINTRQQESCTIKILLPKDYTIAEVPSDVNLESTAGSYHLKYELKEGELVINRKIRFSGKVFSPEEVKEVNDFYNKVHKNDNKSLILLNNNKS
ncbi:DUF3857 domain-containing protein [Mangrovivirga sp. M17]|uniref:DUF3857 domain-containing protein n=1 Tax=Mangrovivirga halotolerans TaxID=2993936 RepID=A0ABT3RWP4_9BACT|nr:DUF3857 domain-containing protein [Mangrovivirga halotolerans]MCX2746086.1 DUF3857 domain-containing protein [Mangrovivirga halotolerans]